MKSSSSFDQEVSKWDGLYTKDRINGGHWAFLPKSAAKRVAERKRVCLEWLRLEKDKSVLDIGCDGGHYGIEIARRGKWFGLDISFQMLAAGKERFDSIKLKGQFINGNVLSLPIRRHSFDGAICIGIINYFTIDKVSLIFDEVNRVLSSGGQFIFTNLRFDTITWCRSRLPAVFPRPLRLPGPLYPHALDKIYSLLEENGFIIKQTKTLKKYKIAPYITLIEAWKIT